MVYELVANGKIAIPASAHKPKTVRVVDPCRIKLLALEKELGFKGSRRINIGVEDYEVEPGGPFPHGFSTMHHGWDETLDRVLYCLDPEVYASLADEDYHFSQ